MNQVNFLPWRRLRKKRRNTVIGFSLVLFAMIVWLIFARLIHALAQDIKKLKVQQNLVKSEIVELEKQEEQLQKVKQYIRHVKRIQISNNSILKALTFLPNLLPYDTYLNKLEINGKQLILQGYSLNAKAILQLLSQSSAQTWLHGSNLQELKQGEMKQAFVFQAMLNQNGMAHD